MRLFIAGELPEAICEALAHTQAELRARIRGRYVPADSFHATLAFLGEVPGSQVESVQAVVERALAGYAPAEVALGGLGSFGRRHAAVVWQALESSALEELARALRAELDGAGLAYDATPFLPHVTLMRVADVTAGDVGMPHMARGEVASVGLFSSELGEDRVCYQLLHRVALTG